MFRGLIICLLVASSFFICDGCYSLTFQPQEAVEDTEIDTVRYVEYEDQNENSNDETEADGGVLTDGVAKGKNNKRLCYPKIHLCSKANGIPVCKKGTAWKRKGFNKSAKSWKIITPLITFQDRSNCCFEVYEYPNYSKQGKHRIIKPGTKEEIFWNIRSLRKSNKKCT